MLVESTSADEGPGQRDVERVSRSTTVGEALFVHSFLRC